MGKRKTASQGDLPAEKSLKSDDNEVLTVPDGWKEPKFTRLDNPFGMLTESSFTQMFPRYREKYIRERWPVVMKKMGEVGLKADLDLAQSLMTVSTARRAWDPYAIINGRDVLKLLARSVPLEQAVRVLNDEVSCDIIKIRSLVGSVERFIKRRERLIGASGETLKALEIVTGCYVIVQGGTVAAIGSYRGLREVRKIVEDCMRNHHPVYSLQVLMLKHMLMKDETMKGQDWSRLLPKFKSKNVQSKVPLKRKKKKQYTPFPPPQQESKLDKELASGEYFVKRKQKHVIVKAKVEKGKSKKKKERKDMIPPKD